MGNILVISDKSNADKARSPVDKLESNLYCCTVNFIESL